MAWRVLPGTLDFGVRKVKNPNLLISNPDLDTSHNSPSSPISSYSLHLPLPSLDPSVLSHRGEHPYERQRHCFPPLALSIYVFPHGHLKLSRTSIVHHLRSTHLYHSHSLLVRSATVCSAAPVRSTAIFIVS